MMKKFKPAEKVGEIDEYWSPRIAAEFNGQQIRLAKLKGEFVWHSHDAEDEVFWVLKGSLDIEFRDRTVRLEEGEVLVVPRGIEHRPVAKEEVHVALIEPESTRNTGQTESDLTRIELDRF